MSITYTHRHVLEDHITGFEARPNVNHLSVIRRPAMAVVLAHGGAESDVDLALDMIEGVSKRVCGPAEWLAVAQDRTPESLLRVLTSIPGASVLDGSDGHVLMRIDGPHARKVLAKCVAVDLHPDVFPIDMSAPMLIAHVAGNLARTGENSFEIIVPRSFAGTVFEEMKEMGRDVALTAGFG
ncbi:sarcosine oxidase subunit gamma [Rhizobium sp. SGZ-381]|uniref:sarcosine oxidase subunit gamma n=1 Tax=Rhizobium sp. SGZ-381 TaxID=3342800 RepID=UPI003671C6A7